MNALGMREVETFAKEWAAAGSHVVQHWQLWEEKASAVFNMHTKRSSNPESMHALMFVVCGVCFGGIGSVKGVIRNAAPSTLTAVSIAVGHLPEFRVLLEAETRFRSCQLVADWMIALLPDGKVAVRSELRSSDGETEH